MEKKISAKENNKQLKKQFIRNLFPNHKEKRKILHKDHRIIQRKFERSVLKDLIQKATFSNQEFRMFIVQRRDAATLIPLIKRSIKTGTDIHSDEWRAYNKINRHGYKHFTVNHKENFVNNARNRRP